MSDTKQLPTFKKQLRRGIAVAVFENQHDDRIFRSVDLQRSYYRNNSWHRMNISLGHEDIPFMIEALKATWEFLNGDTSLRSTEDTDVEAEAYEELG